MRIIGGRDYYDSAGYGFDNSTIFVRKPALLETSPLTYYSRAVSSGTLTRFDIVVAGELYPAIVHTESSYYKNITKYIYNTEDLESIQQLIPKYFYIKETYNLNVSDTHRDTVRRWALDNKITTAISGVETINGEYSIHSNWTRKRGTLVNGDFLKSVDFYRVLPPAQCHQAISSWIGGVLPFNVTTETLSDRSRIQKAGFDLVTSFRKAKS